MKTQNWPIRSKIVALVAVPIVALSALWIFATTLTVGPASTLLATRTLFDEIGRPGEVLVVELQRERRLSVIHVAGGRDAAALGDQRVRTDRAVAEFRRHTSDPDLRDSIDDLLDARLDQLLTAVDALPSGRAFIDQRAVDATGVLGLYSSVVDSAFRTFSALNTLPDETLNREANGLTELGRAREVLAQADALLAGVFTANRFGEGEFGQLVQIIGTHRFLYATVVAELSDADRIEYQRLTEGDSFVRLRTLEERLIGSGGTAALPVDQRAWQSSYEPVQQQLRDFEMTGAEALTERSRPVAIGILLRLGLAGLLGFAAVLLSAVIALRIGRSLVRRLTGLRAAALEMANDRLPEVVGRLRRGEEVDVEREVPPLDYGDDEIGQVGRAFGEVQLTAVSSAVDEATLRRGLREVFLNIARRSQTLLHRQLALLDQMERRTAEPKELADLFRLDHLATRMRRHAEDLVVLAGATAGRGWRNPVSIVDVVRGAISEVEDYPRVDLATVPPAAIAGRAVGDVIHLLAELIENAARFSPPHTRVQVSGEVVPNGYAIEIEDRGLGMSAEAIERANRRLADPPDFEPANSARLGLFVVALLGARHNVKVQLRSSPYGGVTAVALVPGDLVVADDLVVPAEPGVPAELAAGVPAPRGGRSGPEPQPAWRPESSQPESSWPGSSQPDSSRPDPLRPESSRPDPLRSDPLWPDPSGRDPERPVGPAAEPAGAGAGTGPGAERGEVGGAAPVPEPRQNPLGPRRTAGAALDALVKSSGPMRRLAADETTRADDDTVVLPPVPPAGPVPPGLTGASPTAAAPAGSGGPSQAGSSQAGSSQAGSSQVGSSQVGSSQVGSSQVGSSQVGSSQVGSSPAGPSDPAPAAAEQVGWPARAGSTGPDGAAQPPPAAPGGPRRPTVAPVGEDGLPRRIRQTNLAPQLLATRPGPPVGAADPAGAGRGRAVGAGVAGDPSDEPSPRTPEQIRAVMAALQAGTTRGRRDAGAPPASVGPRPETVPPTGSGDPAPAPARDEPKPTASSGSSAGSDAARVTDPGSTESEGDA
ncbi:nitrate- and nitrite sensing domain-containing protein [Plantactinospora sp. CA-290183]|uniref:sensor histidine kinase n=1 Tax=Plantactinospora sp. CA-290183 TaxID=3240006 RepID=UPI003D929332